MFVFFCKELRGSVILPFAAANLVVDPPFSDRNKNNLEEREEDRTALGFWELPSLGAVAAESLRQQERTSPNATGREAERVDRVDQMLQERAFAPRAIGTAEASEQDGSGSDGA